MDLSTTMRETTPVDAGQDKEILSMYADGELHRYDPRFIEMFGLAGGIFLSQLMFCMELKSFMPGWVYKSEDEWRKETGLPRNQQRKARKVLGEAGVLLEKQANGPDFRRRNFYRVDLWRLIELVPPVDEGEMEAVTETPDPDGLDEWPGEYGIEPQDFGTPDDDDAPTGDAPEVFEDEAFCLEGDPFEVAETRPASETDVGLPSETYGGLARETDVGLAIQRERQRHATENTPESSVFHTGDASLSLRSPGKDEVNHKGMDTATPPPDDLDTRRPEMLDAGGTEDHEGGGKPSFDEFMRGVLGEQVAERLTQGRPARVGGEVAA